MDQGFELSEVSFFLLIWLAMMALICGVAAIVWLYVYGD